jgi:branched-chain amino acid transport system permease protein
MVVFSLLLMAVVIFRQRGLMGNKELTWDTIGKAVRGAARGVARLGGKGAGRD